MLMLSYEILLYLVPHSTTLHLLVIHMQIFRCGAHHLRLPHSQTNALVSDHCFSFPIMRIPIQLLFYHLQIGFLSFHLLLSKFLSPLCSSPILFSRVTHSTHFSPSTGQANGEGLLLLDEQLKKTLYNSDRLNLIMFSVGTKQRHKAQSKSHKCLH